MVLKGRPCCQRECYSLSTLIRVSVYLCEQQSVESLVYCKGSGSGVYWYGLVFFWMRRDIFQDLAGQYSAKQCLIMAGEESGPCDSG